MTDKPRVQALGDHNYVIHVEEGEDTIEIRVHASPDVVARIAAVDTDENRIIEATAAYLIARQRADDLPTVLDLNDVEAAYDGYIEDISNQFGHR
ncbi:MAG: hypothetical protein ABIP03_00630 [Aquihabitans sp.]